MRAHGVLLNGPLEDLEERMFWEEVAVVKRIEWNGLDMVVKYGRKVSEVEAEVLKMVRSETAAPVPKVRLTFFSTSAIC